MGFFFKCLREEVFTHEPQSELLKLITLFRASQFWIAKPWPMAPWVGMGNELARCLENPGRFT